MEICKALSTIISSNTYIKYDQTTGDVISEEQVPILPDACPVFTKTKNDISIQSLETHLMQNSVQGQEAILINEGHKITTECIEQLKKKCFSFVKDCGNRLINLRKEVEFYELVSKREAEIIERCRYDILHLSGYIRVFTRCRPLLARETDDIVVVRSTDDINRVVIAVIEIYSI